MKKSLLVVLIVGLVAILQFTYFMKSQPNKVESSEAIYFVVNRVEMMPDSTTYSVYDEQGNAFKGYAFSAAVKIEEGDIIAKEANSNELVVYRFDQNGKKEVFFKGNMEEK